MRLDVEGLETEFAEPRVVVRHERETRHAAREADVLAERRLEIEDDPAEWIGRHVIGIVAKRTLPHALLREHGQIDVGDDDLRVRREARRFDKRDAVLIDRALAVPGEIGRRFARAGRRIEIGGKAAPRMRLAEKFAIIRLADDDVARRQIRDDGRARQSSMGRRRNRNPDILADFDGQPEIGKIARLEDQIDAERRFETGKRDRLLHDLDAGGEMPPFVELTIIRQIGFRHDAEQRAAMDHQRAIVEPRAPAHRRPDDNDRHQRAGCLQEMNSRLLDGGQKRILMQQIVDRIGRQREFGKDDQPGAARIGVAAHGGDRLDVEGRIGDAHARRAGCNPHEVLGIEGEESSLRHVPII